MVVSLETTHRKQAEEVLQKYEHIVYTSTDMMAFLDKQYIYLAANTEYINAFDLTSEMIIGKPVADVFGENMFNTVIKPHADGCLAGEEINYQEWFDFPSGGKRYMDINYYPYFNKDNQVMGFVVNGRNITNRLQAEQKIKSTFERFTNAEEIARMGSWQWNPNTDVVHWSDNMCRLYGIEPSDFDPSFDYAIRFTHPDDIKSHWE